jgi:hypothetical protein
VGVLNLHEEEEVKNFCDRIYSPQQYSQLSYEGCEQKTKKWFVVFGYSGEWLQKRNDIVFSD